MWKTAAIALLAVLIAFAATTRIKMASSGSSALLKTLVVPAASGKASASVIFSHGLGDSGLGWLDGGLNGEYLLL